jgi:hypothetical protein
MGAVSSRLPSAVPISLPARSRTVDDGMSNPLAVPFLTSLLLCSPAAASAEQGLVRVAGTQVSVVPPAGFEPAKQFPGFQRIDVGSSLMVTEIPGPFEGVRSGLTKEGLAAQGMTFLSSESARFADAEGVLVHASQEANGTLYRKWIGVFGTPRKTALVAGTFPDAVAADMSEPLKFAVLSARLGEDTDPGLFEGLPFRVQEAGRLKFAGRLANNLMLTVDGKRPPLAPGEPLVVVGPSISDVNLEDVKAFAETRVLQTATVEDIRVVTGKAITVGSLRGYELEAQARHSKSGLAMVVYQAILVKGKGYYMLQGLVEASRAAHHLADFRAVLSSLSVPE